jgi:hypothetical protein
MCCSIGASHQSVHLSVCSEICFPVHLFVFFDLSAGAFHLFWQTNINPNPLLKFVYPSVCPFMSLCFLVRLSHQSVYPCVKMPLLSCMFRSLYLSVCLSAFLLHMFNNVIKYTILSSFERKFAPILTIFRGATTLSITTLSIIADCYAGCHLWWVPFKLSAIHAECHLCRMSQLMSICWVSLCWMSLCWMPLRWMSRHHFRINTSFFIDDFEFTFISSQKTLLFHFFYFLSVNIFPTLLAETHFTDWHLTDRHLVDRNFVDTLVDARVDWSISLFLGWWVETNQSNIRI